MRLIPFRNGLLIIKLPPGITEREHLQRTWNKCAASFSPMSFSDQTKC